MDHSNEYEQAPYEDLQLYESNRWGELPHATRTKILAVQ
jgi:hypothetical protein